MKSYMMKHLFPVAGDISGAHHEKLTSLYLAQNVKSM